MAIPSALSLLKGSFDTNYKYLLLVGTRLRVCTDKQRLEEKTRVNRKPVVSTLATASLVTSLVLAACGASEDDNNQPTIEPISDKTLDIGDTRTLRVYITDTDVDDTHVISAFSDDTTVATVSVKDSTLTIAGSEGGTTTVTVSATDDSGQDNAVAIPATFLVTVIEPINRGACMVGMTLQAGESCSYGPRVVFSVRQDGSVCRESELPLTRVVFGVNVRIGKICGDYDIERDDTFGTDFAASKNPDGSWTIDNVP